jgi:hypothetical protein
MLRRNFLFLSAASSASLFAPTAARLNRTQRKGAGANPYQSDGAVSDSFEKIVDDIGNAMPFKMKEEYYDKPENTRKTPDHPEAYATPTSGQEAANASLSGKDPSSSRVPRERFMFDKTYDPDLLKKSTCSPEHYYPPPPTKKEVERRRKVRQTWIVTLVALLGMLFLMDQILRPLKQATVMIGRTANG